MDFETYSFESERNRRAYLSAREAIRSQFAGQYVTVANGRVLGGARTFDAACELVNSLSPVPEYSVVFPAEMEPNFDLVYDLSCEI